MNITDIFIRRPVLSTVVSLVILVLGLKAAVSMPVRQYPRLDVATVTVTTVYFGASPETIAGFVTSPLEAAISQAQGIDYITSKSISGASTITVTLRLNYNVSRALTEINTKINSVKNQLPAEAQQPQIQVSTGETTASMYITFTSEVLAANSITDYLIREVQPKLQTLPGIQSADILGARTLALRVWLDPVRLAGLGMTATDVYAALSANNYVSALGRTKGSMITVDMTAQTNLQSLDDFRSLVVKRQGSSLVRLEDVATVTLGAEDYDRSVAFDGKKAVFMAISVAPDANILDAIAGVREAFPEIQRGLPSGVNGRIVYDATKFVNSSINEVIKTLIEALVIVTLVIYLFLGNFRAVLIPTVAMPLSLIGAFFIMLVMGYTINLLTLLALVLAIGLVVDDAIIVVENVDRHLKEGKSPMQSALLGAKELTGPIIAISVVLIAVYVPVGFQGGLTGALFSEFAFTLAGAVGISAVVALTLSPMMCSRFLSAEEGQFQHKIDEVFLSLKNSYGRWLDSALSIWKVVVVFGFLLILLIAIMAKMSRTELAPQEDQGFAFSIATAAPNASPSQMDGYAKQMYEVLSTVPERDRIIQFVGIMGSNTALAGMAAKAWEDRERNMKDIIADIQMKFNEIAGIRAFVVSPPALPGGGSGPPFQMVIKTTEPFQNLYEVTQAVVQAGQASGKFFFLDSDLKIDKPQVRVKVDRDRAAAMGLSMRDIGNPLSAMLAGGYVNYFTIEGRAYKVIPQVSQLDRLSPEQISDYYLRTATGKLVSAASVVSLETMTVPQSVNRFQQLNSATIQGVPNSFAGVTMGDAINIMNGIASEIMPAGYSIDYAGQARQTVQESSSFATTMAFALLIIFLVLAAQFESFRDPIVIMASVPMAIFGAMVFIFEGAATLNIYTEVGLVTLVGLISKHGILIVQFANDLQKSGINKLSAIREASGTRLRPILMTTAAMVLGVLPLVLASGAGAVGRYSMGLVIASGISIGTVFTLFVVPCMYMWLATDHQKQAKSNVDI